MKIPFLGIFAPMSKNEKLYLIFNVDIISGLGPIVEHMRMFEVKARTGPVPNVCGIQFHSDDVQVGERQSNVLKKNIIVKIRFK